jgi:photosystem II stability/assembly factor-like uncharacterized protein
VLAGLLACTMAGSAIAQEKQETESNNIEQKRQEWFYGQRAYPHPYVPSGAHLNAVRQLRQKLAAEAAARQAGKLLATPAWTPIGPQPINTPYTDPVVSGRITAIAIDPANSNHVYAAGAQGGVWQTTDGGNTWASLTDNQPSLAVGSLILDPSNSRTIYAGTGEENFSGDSYYGAGILKSTDGGATWTQYCGPFCGPVGQDGFYGGGARIGGLAVQPSNNQVLLAAVALLFQDGVYRSANGGVSWTQVLSGNPGTAVLFDPNSPNTAYAALGNSFGGTEGVYKSSDGGQTWTPDNGSGVQSLPLTNAARIVLAMAPSSTTTLYAGIANLDGSLLGLFKTTNGGAAWQQLTSAPDYCTPQCSYDNVIAVDPVNPNVIYAGGAYTTTLIRSLDGGNTWATLQSAQNYGFLHADTHALAFSPAGGKLYLGNDGGMYVTTQVTAGNPAFTALNTTLSVTQFYPGITILPGNPSVAMGGTQDNGTVIYSGSSTWNQVTCGDGSYTAIDFVNTNNYYAACEEIYVQKSTAAGASNSWALAVNGINTGDRVDFIPPLVMDPSNSSTLYFGTYRVYQTTNGAGVWTPVSPDLTNGSGFWAVVTSIAVAPTDSNTVYAGTGDSHVQVTTNAGSGASAHWTDVSAGLPPRIITQVAVDPTVSTAAYVTFSGFTGFGDNLGHIFRTTNGGATWTDISGDLPNTPINCMVVDPAYPSALFAGTDVGMFYTLDGGNTWNTLVNGLPTVAVLGLALDAATNTLRSATHGRGVWDLNISDLIPAPAVSLNPTSLAFPAQVIGTSSKPKAVTLTNTGGGTLTLSISISGDYSQTNNCGTSVAAGASCIINVTFKPAAKGGRTGTLSLADNAAGSPQTVPLAGAGTVVKLTPPGLNFGSVPVGQTSAPQNMTLTNVSRAPLSIGGMGITGTNRGDFSLTTTCGSTVAARASCTISVTFKPSAKGTRKAALAVSDNGGGSPQKAGLTGTGT